MKKRLLSSILAITLVFSLFVPAYADADQAGSASADFEEGSIAQIETVAADNNGEEQTEISVTLDANGGYFFGDQSQTEYIVSISCGESVYPYPMAQRTQIRP